MAKPFDVRLSDHSKQTVWQAWGDTPEEALEQWNSCFDHAGGKFEFADPKLRAKALAR